MPIKNKTLPSQEELKKLFSYDSKSGILIWIGKACRRDPPGMAAGWYDSKGYLHVSIKRHKYQVHRVIWKWFCGVDPNEIDHINGIRDDNRISNLRDVTTTQNRCNQLTIVKKRGVGLKGVYKPKNRNYWIAQIKLYRRHYYLGTFQTEEAAHAAYVAKAIELHGQFANDGDGPCLSL